MVIYLVRNLVNQKTYVGKTKCTPKRRWDRHVSDARRNSQCYFHKAIRKHGIENFTIEVLESVTDSNWREREKFYIQLLRSSDQRFGYNLTLGGEGVVPTEITRARMRQARLGKKHSEATKQAIRAAKTGVTLNQQVRDNIRNGHLGIRLTAEHKQKISQAKLGKPRSEAAKLNLSITRRSITHCIRGHKFSPENTYIRRDGKRMCRACARLFDRKRKGISYE